MDENGKRLGWAEAAMGVVVVVVCVCVWTSVVVVLLRNNAKSRRLAIIMVFLW